MKPNNLSFVLTCLVVLGGLGPRHSWANDTDYAPPAGYYDLAAGLTGSALKSQLTTIMSSGFHGRSYGDFRYAAAVLDADPNHAGNILLIYNRASVSNAWDSGATWNREHQWPVSLLGTKDPDNGDINMETDEFFLRPCDPSLNSSRGNSPYGTVTSSGACGYQTAGYYYVGDADRGDVARTMFYLVTRYPSFSGHTLALVNGNPTTYQMGDLNSFLHWHYADAPDTFELRRNQAVYSSTMNPSYYQGNRNAFIDHPEYVWSVLVSQANDTSITTSTNLADLGRVLVGASFGAQMIAISKTGTNGTYYEVRTNGPATSTVLGRCNAFAMDGPGSRVTTVGLSASTASAGLKSGTVTVDNLDITTQGGAGKGANDPDDVITVAGTVLDHALPSFTDSSTTQTLGLNFGTLAGNSGSHELTFDLFNRVQTPGYTARLGLTSIAFSGDTNAISSTLATFTNLDSGSHRTFSVFLDTTRSGTFAGTYSLTCADEVLPGAQTFSPLTITVTGTVVAVPPTVTTGPATAVGVTAATLNGTVNPNLQTTTVYFEYGLTTSYGLTAAVSGTFTGAIAQAVSANITGLAAGTTYHFRAVATNVLGSAYGLDQTFATTSVPDLAIAARHSGSFTQGDTADSYTLMVTNTGTAASSGTVTVVDTLPTGLAATAICGDGWAADLGTLTCTRSDALAAGAAYPPITVTVRVSADALASLTNVVSISGGGDISPVNNTANDPTIVLAAAAPTVTTGVAAAVDTTAATLNGTVNPNSQTATVYFEYGLTTDYGSAAAVSGTFMGATEQAVSANVTGLAAGTLYHFRAVATNVLGVATGLDQTFATTVPPAPDLAITATHSGSFTQGDPSDYFTIIVTNVGTAASSGDVTVVDTLPIGLTATAISGDGWTADLGTLTCTRSDPLATGAAYPPITITVSVAADAAANLTNLVSISGGGDLSPANNTVGDPTTINAAAAPTVVTDAATAVEVTSATLNGTVNPNLQPATVYFEYGLTTDYGSTASVAGTFAGATAQAFSADLTGLAADTLYHFRAVATNALGSVNGLDQTFTTSPTPVPDLAITGTHGGSFTQGDTSDYYTIIVTNAGTAASSGPVTVVDTLPTGLTAIAISGDGWTPDLGTLTCTRSDALTAGAAYPPITVTVSVAADAAASLTNLVSVSGGGDLNPANDAAADPTTIDVATAPTVTTDAANPVGAITATLNGTVNPNSQPATVYFEYGLTTDYGSTATVSGTFAGATVQAVSANLTGLAGSTVYHFRAVATNALGSVTGLDQTFTTAVPVPDLAIAATHSGDFTQGDTADTYIILITNVGTAALSDTVTVVDTLPTGLTATAISGDGWSADLGTLTCTRSDALAAGASYPPITVTVSVSADAPASLTNTAVVTGEGDLSPGNNTVSDPTTILPAAAPIVSTDVASAVGCKAAILNGYVNPNGQPAMAQFEYGLTASYGSVLTVPDCLSGTTTQAVTTGLSELLSATTYHFRLVATNVLGATIGQDQVFTTLAPIEAWRLQWFGTTDNSGPAADSTITTSDGMPNLVKYALGLDPLVATNNPVAGDISTGYLRLTAPKNPEATDVTFQVEVTDDLTTSAWTTSGTTVDTNTPTLLQVHANAPVASSGAGFIRLRVSRP
jgi:uncharacterized repeat protein (TIGR01451 family)